MPLERLNQVHKEAEAKQISPNTLVNQIIKEHLDWHSRAAAAKLYYLPKSFLKRLIDQLTEEQLHGLARDTVKSDLVDICLFLRGVFSIASIFDITQTWLRVSQMPYRLEINGDSSKIIIEHDMGMKYSYLIKEISRYLFEVAFEAKTYCDITDSAVIIKLHDNTVGDASSASIYQYG
jgi:hypothetical protein